MVKLRSAKYCNVKLLLILLVIYGHLIEPGIWNQRSLMLQYKGIYLVHMPLFAFLSGLFLKRAEDCKGQLCRLLPLYFLFQTLAVVLGGGKVRFLTPYWHLWYLLSCCMWLGFGWLWYVLFHGKGKYIILACTVAAGCFVGYAPSVGRMLSLSRTVVFLPYFWLGLISEPETDWRRLFLPALFGSVASLVLFAFLEGRISPAFLYQATHFDGQREGALLRMLCYCTGVSLCILMLSVTPAKRFPFTRAGADTLPAYLIHAPVVLFVRKWDIPWQLFILIAMLILYLIHKLLRWFGNLYGITERRG